MKGDVLRISILLIDDDQAHAAALIPHLGVHRYHVTLCPEPREALAQLSRFSLSWHAIIWNVTRSQWNCLETLRAINDFFQGSPHSSRPRILCFSAVYRGPQFRLEVERLGARLVYEQ